jgi:hypothetical protein
VLPGPSHAACTAVGYGRAIAASIAQVFPIVPMAGEAEGRRGVCGGELGRPLITRGERTRSFAKRFLDDDIMSYILVFMQKIWLYLLQFC